MKNKDKIRILSIDGGGTKGIIPITILSEIEVHTGKKIIDLFDIIVGTSTGGIITLGIGSKISFKDLESLYLTKAREIFAPKKFLKIPIRHPFTNRFSNKNLKKYVTQVFSEPLGEKKRRCLTMSDLWNEHPTKAFLVTSFNLKPKLKTGENINFRPRLFNSTLKKHKDINLWEIAMMTSAAPTYLPSYNEHIDGGVALNNPSLSGISFAINKLTGNPNRQSQDQYRQGHKGWGYDLNDISVLSIGCGTTNNLNIYEELNKSVVGSWGWKRYIGSLLTESNGGTGNFFASRLLDKRYLRLQPDFSQKYADKSIRNKKIDMATTKQKHLLGMQTTALTYFERNKADIVRFFNGDFENIDKTIYD